jgi:hypothetical protein
VIAFLFFPFFIPKVYCLKSLLFIDLGYGKPNMNQNPVPWLYLFGEKRNVNFLLYFLILKG